MQGQQVRDNLASVNSGLLKLSKMLPATAVGRGSADGSGQLPREFWEANRFNVRGGVKYGFISTATDPNAARNYLGSGGDPFGRGL